LFFFWIDSPDYNFVTPKVINNFGALKISKFTMKAVLNLKKMKAVLQDGFYYILRITGFF